jgi:hypothetical protein
MDAIPVKPVKAVLDAEREAVDRASGEWRGAPLRRGERSPPNGQCVVYVLLDAGDHPISASSKNRCSRQLADRRAAGVR